MFSSLSSALSLITGPALLTNASTVMLLGATNRYGMTVTALRETTEALDVQGPTSLSQLRRRARLLSRAMLCLQLAVGSFGLSTLSALIGLCFEQTVMRDIETVVTPVLLSCAAIGGMGLILSVSTLFFESWSSDHDLLVPAHRAERF